MAPTSPLALERGRVASLFGRARDLAGGFSFLEERVVEELLDRLSLQDAPKGAWLDLGCGRGEAIQRLESIRPDNGIDVVGIDLLPAPVGLRAVGDAHRLPLKRASFGLVLSNLMLPWCDAGQVFREVRRILRPSGLFLFSTYGPGTLEEPRQAWALVDDLPHVHSMIDLHELGDALLGSGFAAPVLDSERLEIEYGSLDRLLEDLRGGGYTNLLAGRRRTLTGKGRFEAFRRSYEEMADGRGRIPATFEVLYGYARAPGGAVRVAVPG